MQKYWNTVQDERGNPRYGASVSVQQNGVNSAIYTDSAGLVPAANPLTTDSTRGYFEFYAAAGTYDLSIFGVGFSPYTITGGAILGLPSGDVTFTQSGTGAVSTTVQEYLRFQRIIHGWIPTSLWASMLTDTNTTDLVPYFQAAITALGANGGRLICPTGFYYIGSKFSITTPVCFQGDGIGATVFDRHYSPSNNYDGIINYTDGGTEGGLSNLSLRSLTGQTGGCLLSIKPTASGALGLYNFDNLDLTTTGSDTHNYTVYIDGTAKTGAPIGVRGVYFKNCAVFGAATKAMLLKGVVHGSFLGGQVDPAGGSSGAVQFDGTAGVQTQDFLFAPNDALGGLDFDQAKKIIVMCPELAAISNTANTSNIVVVGQNSGTVQSNWTKASVINPDGGVNFKNDGSLSLGTNFVYTAGTGLTLSSGEYITAKKKSSSTTEVAHIGQTAAFACADTKTFTFTLDSSSKLFKVSTGGGAGVLCFADYVTAAITLVSNPSGLFENSAAPAGTHTGIFKSANSHVISVKNNTGGSANYDVQAVGPCSATTDPA